MGRRGPNLGKCIALHQTYHWLSSIAFLFIRHYNKKRLKPLKNEEQKMEFCVFSSTFCHSRQLRVWLWNLWDAISWAIIKWNWSAWVYNINTTQKKHATQTTDNTHNKAQWDFKNCLEDLAHMFFYVKLNFKLDLFSSTFWFEHSLRSENAYL